MKIKSNVEIITKLLLFLVVALCLVGSASADDIWVDTPVTATTINNAIATASAGDVVIIPDGEYASLNQIVIGATVDGTEGSPITLRAETPGGVNFTGNSASPLIFVQGDWWIIRDFQFINVSEVGDVHTYGIITRDVTGTRVTNTYWEGFGVQTDTDKRSWCIWLAHGGIDNHTRIDHNTFSENEAVCIAVGPGSSNSRADHNYFKDSLRDGGNGFEAIHNEADNHIAEYNLFENMWADPETISNKGSDNTYRYNVLKNTGGAAINGFVIRSGQNCIVEGNYFFNISTHGIRVHDTGHKIINNYFENSSYSAILLAEGNNGASYDNVADIRIIDNTIVDPIYRGIDIGWWPECDVKPDNLTFINNIIVSDVTGSYLVRDGGHTGPFVWTTNLHYATGSANYWNNDGGGDEPGSGITHANPNLTTGYGIYRLQSSSTNAIEQGTPISSVTDDIDGQVRDDTNPDIGCDEYNTSPPLRLPITEDDVGHDFDASNAPNITSWENDKTSNNTLDITINTSESINFNATANQTITTWNWYKDDVDQSHNYDNISLSWSTPGLKHVIVNATNTNGTSSSITWNVTAESLIDTSDFTYYKIITLNQSMINQSIGTGKYPLLVSDTDTDLRDRCQDDGDDIVYFDADNTTQLAHENETWVNTTGEIVHWVGLEDVTNVSYIVMYYGNATIANSENATGVWDSNYMMVQHFQETDIDGGAGDIKDSTSNDNDGTTHNMTTANLDTGLINGCFNFSVSNEARVNVSDDSTLDGFTSGFTISGLFNFNQEGAYYLVNKYDAGGDQRAWLLKLQGDDNLRIYVDDAGTAAEISNFNPTIVPGTDYKIDAVWESGEYPILYVNGALANEVDHDGLVSSIKDSTSILRIGGGYSPGNTYFTGDEIRVSNIGRSQAYVETDTNNTLYPDLFISIGSEQGGGAPDTKFEYWTGSTWVDDEAQYYLWFTCFWHTAECANAEQSGSQATLKITNNGTASGTPKMKLNESAPSGIRIFVDDDNTFADAVELSNTYQAVSTSLNNDTNITLWVWANLSGADNWEFETYAIVE